VRFFEVLLGWPILSFRWETTEMRDDTCAASQGVGLDVRESPPVSCLINDFGTRKEFLSSKAAERYEKSDRRFPSWAEAQSYEPVLS